MASRPLPAIQAEQLITRWAEHHFRDEEEEITPAVQVLSLAFHSGQDEWEAELVVSTSADNPHVTFVMSAQPGQGLHIVRVE